MRVFVTGASGFIGSAIVSELIAAGHNVIGLVRSDAGARSLAAAGGEVQRGDLADRDILRQAVAASDGVIHTAYNHDFMNVSREAAGEADVRVIETMGDVLANSGRPLVITTAIGRLISGQAITEQDVPDPSTGSTHRMPSERAAVALAARGVRTSIIRLPPSVHGAGDYGFVPALIRIAREKGVSAYVGEGRNRWPAVHRLDAANLYRLAFEKGAAGSVFHGVADEGIPTREIATAIGRHLNLPVVSKSVEEAAAHFTFLARFYGNDVPATSARTQELLGWRTQQPGLLADLEHGHYFD